MLRPHVTMFLDAASAFRQSELDLEIEQLQISASSPLVSNTLEQLRLSGKYGVIVLAIQRKRVACNSIPLPTCESKSAMYSLRWVKGGN
jgi:uncharacterized protein with PhoU and TrkA domain